MAHLALVAAGPVHLPGPQVAHDLRNILASIGLHVETLQRLSGPGGAKAADAAYSLLTRCTLLCNHALDSTDHTGAIARRRRIDVIQTARQVADLLAASAPKGFSFDIEGCDAAWVLADPNDLFRILFNVMSNAVSIAGRKANALKSMRMCASTEASVVTVHVRDDGPGLPHCVKARLFRAQPKQPSATRHGYGLAIARELAERNGGTLTLARSAKGAHFELKLASGWAPSAADNSYMDRAEPPILGLAGCIRPVRTVGAAAQ